LQAGIASGDCASATAEKAAVVKYHACIVVTGVSKAKTTFSGEAGRKKRQGAALKTPERRGLNCLYQFAFDRKRIGINSVIHKETLTRDNMIERA
jgi:hypothetical protein